MRARLAYRVSSSSKWVTVTLLRSAFTFSFWRNGIFLSLTNYVEPVHTYTFFQEFFFFLFLVFIEMCVIRIRRVSRVCSIIFFLFLLILLLFSFLPGILNAFSLFGQKVIHFWLMGQMTRNFFFLSRVTIRAFKMRAKWILSFFFFAPFQRRDDEKYGSELSRSL